MASFLFSGLCTRFILLSLAAILPILSLRLYSSSELQNFEINQAKKQALNLAQRMGDIQNHLVRDAQHIVFSLSLLSGVG